MKHKLTVHVKNSTGSAKLLTHKRLRIRERLMRLLLGELKDVIVILPGKTVDELVIDEKSVNGNI